MPNLASRSVGNIFTIPAGDWTIINKRVGEVLAAQKIQNVIAEYLPGYPALLTSSKLWQQSTFNGLIAESGDLANYAGTAITNFTSLNAKVKQVVGNTVPDSLKDETMTLLKNLASDTTPLATASNTLSDRVLTFLNDNKAVDAQIAVNKDKLGGFWAPLGDIINSLEDAAGLVTGSWRAITDDLNNTLASPVTVTMPFIESLNIDAALVNWKSLQSDALAFSSLVKEQSQYWRKPI